MAKDTTNWVGLIADLGRHLFCDSIVVQVQDIIRALGIQSREGLSPIVCHHHKIDTGWHIVINIPVGLCSDDIIHWLQYFEEQLSAYIEPTVNGNKVHLDIHTTALPLKVPYSFNPQNYPQMHLPIPIGISHQGLIVADLAMLPHMFLAGTTRAGKTTQLKTLTQALLEQGVEVTLIDLKQLGYSYARRHVHLVETLEDAKQVVADLKQEMYRRNKVLERAGVDNWYEYKGDMVYKALIIDELGELTDKEAQLTLESLIKLCGASGISILAATQRPSAKLWRNGDFREVVSLFDARICYRTVDTFNSEIVLGKGNTAAYDHIKKSERGRAIWKCDGETLIQSLFIENPKDLIKTIPVKVVTEVEPKPEPDTPPKESRFNP